MGLTKIYVGIWVGLMAASAMEVAVRIFAGDAATVIFFISIVAAVQAIIVSMYYQHLRYEQIQLAALPLAAVASVAFLAVAAGFSIAMGS